jgi:hypothetical protein
MSIKSSQFQDFIKTNDNFLYSSQFTLLNFPETVCCLVLS